MKDWWKKKWGNGHICGITHARIRPGKGRYGLPYSIKLKCSHEFYTNALLEWIRVGNNTCPMCRKKLDIFSEILN